MAIYDHSKYVSLTMEFRCNLACKHCMIEGTMDRLAPQSDEAFARLLEHNARTGDWTGLILTGSEITLRRDLPELARRARASGFEHVRIQTHGMHLGRAAYSQALVEAGIDEFFVSVAGSDAASHDGITTVDGSFEKTLRGLEILDSYDGVATITNTVVTEDSYRLLPGIVSALGHLRKLTQMEFWFYFPMKETDEKGLVANHLDALPYLREATRMAQALGREVEIKNYPECLLGADSILLVNDQPQLFIDPAFWDEFARNGFYQCPHRDNCVSKQCLGLNTAYIKRFGDHKDLLRPFLGPAAEF
ncbi:MoaA/NifB/PqqE/SkfB family radical SAM enzyme [Aminobacter aminovorans]|jgi:MoaA/NifB/PqqE/SkfB family radical SAM enzyme|uniref:Molybdenum cofactor biosynthesis protein A n=1 Tax=Aminobacter aminovorans TaxID=83263 RepID=A0A381IJW3_AMIAI|nr:radical SAM protein [Aminobacter aminovorans]TCS24890.1 MoaA/NifB/PqqE/SkfB family radical SAM enzyme [Aminobacter aminovorans]SUY28030.1 molybdenum cofactor biosynthesis protein A [Aminobacter aminovorans]